MPGKNTPSTDPQTTVGSRIDERLDHLEALVAALSAEIDLLRAEHHEWREAEGEAEEVAGEDRVGPRSDNLQAVEPGDGTDAGLARVAALQLVDAGLDRKAVTAELRRLGMDDPEPVVDEVFRHEQPARRAS
jgi:hypothetical protein